MNIYKNSYFMKDDIENYLSYYKKNNSIDYDALFKKYDIYVISWKLSYNFDDEKCKKVFDYAFYFKHLLKKENLTFFHIQKAFDFIKEFNL